MLARTPKILTVLTFIFAWLPAFILAVICCSMIIGALYSIIYGISSGSYSDTYNQSILSLLLGILMWVFGLFGFVGLSSVVIGPQLKPVTRITFLFLASSPLFLKQYIGRQRNRLYLVILIRYTQPSFVVVYSLS